MLAGFSGAIIVASSIEIDAKGSSDLDTRINYIMIMTLTSVKFNMHMGRALCTWVEHYSPKTFLQQYANLTSYVQAWRQ